MRATGPRVLTRWYGETVRPALVPCKIKAGAVIYGGTMVALTNDGLLVSAAEPDAARVVGRVDNTLRNTSGNAIDGEFRRGVFNWASDGSLNQSHVGKRVYVVDDQTVGAAGTVLAGVLLFIDNVGYWVESSPELISAVLGT